jgi:hypothetical protein
MGSVRVDISAALRNSFRLMGLTNSEWQLFLFASSEFGQPSTRGMHWLAWR